MTRFAVCALFLLQLLGGCGEDSSREGDAGETAPPPPRAAPQVITEVDRGGSFMLAVGSETALRLSANYTWSEPTVRGDAVELARVDYLQDPGFSEWMVVAARAGTASVTAVGTPACDGQEGCPDEPLRFQVELTVE
jgi:predicted secreted protein